MNPLHSLTACIIALTLSATAYADSATNRDITGVWSLPFNATAAIVQSHRSITIDVVQSSGKSLTYSGNIESSGRLNTFHFVAEATPISYRDNKHGICTASLSMLANGTVLGEFPDRNLAMKEAVIIAHVSCHDGFENLITKDYSGDWK